MSHLLENSSLSIIVTVALSDKNPMYQVYDLNEESEAEEWINEEIDKAKKEQSKYDGVQILNYISADIVRFSEDGDRSILGGRKFHIVEDNVLCLDGAKIQTSK